MIRFRCPKCESQMEVDESFAGRAARCPTCGCDLKVPKEGEPSAPVQPARAATPKGAATVTVDGETVEVVPPLETMVPVAIGFVVLSVLAFVVSRMIPVAKVPWWTVGGILGALLALLGVMTAIPAYHTVRRSRGRKRGRGHAIITMGAGALLFLVFGVIALIGVSQSLLRPTCKDNLEQIYQALRAYADRHDGAFPKRLEALVEQGYLDSPNWLTCPAYHVRLGETTYILTPDINVSAKQPDGTDWWPTDIMIVSDGAPYDAHGDGYVRVLLLGGEIKYVELAHWTAYQKGQADRWSKILNRIRQAQATAPEADQSPPTPAPAKEGAP